MLIKEDGEAVVGSDSAVTTSNIAIADFPLGTTKRRKPEDYLLNSTDFETIRTMKEDFKDYNRSKLWEQTYDYSSVQFIFNDGFSYRIRKFASNLIDSNDIIELETTPHVTVKYGIEDSNPTLSFNLLAPFLSSRPLIELSPTSVFEGEENDVVVLLVKSDYLHFLNDYIKKNIKCVDTFPNYIPHITLGYVKKGTGRKYANKMLLEQSTAYLDKLQFSSKNGSLTDYSSFFYSTEYNLSGIMLDNIG